MNRPALTRRQRQIVDFLESYGAEHGMSPTLEEIAREFGVNKVTIFGHVAELERKGVIRRAAPGVSRGLQLVEAEAPTSATKLTILGQIAAGLPIETIEAPETLDLQDLLPSDRDVYALRVSGDSMIEDAIRDGDIVVVERRPTANNGETVVAVLPDGNATLKRFYKNDEGIRLQPANSTMDPILIPPGADIEIRGVVIGVVRQF